MSKLEKVGAVATTFFIAILMGYSVVEAGIAAAATLAIASVILAWTAPR